MSKAAEMARVRTTGTEPELVVRRTLYAKGVRYRLNYAKLPGKPDIYIPRLRIAVFIHGCFWHRHSCPRGRLPHTNRRFWQDKLALNVFRDRRIADQLERLGIRVITLWACELTRMPETIDQIAEAYGLAGAGGLKS